MILMQVITWWVSSASFVQLAQEPRHDKSNDNSRDKNADIEASRSNNTVMYLWKLPSIVIFMSSLILQKMLRALQDHSMLTKDLCWKFQPSTSKFLERASSRRRKWSPPLCRWANAFNSSHNTVYTHHHIQFVCTCSTSFIPKLLNLVLVWEWG